MHLSGKKLAMATGALLLVCQIIPLNRRNPPFEPSQTLYATQAVPKDVKAVFERSCKNCHSDDTAWPWYSYIAPISWVIVGDVNRARRHMNFSEWGSYSANKRAEKLESICEQLVDGDMPDRKYMLLHREARTSPQERSAVCQWTDDAREY